MSRPVIGITTYAEEARFGLVDTFAAVLPLSYVHAVHDSGGRAVLITPDDPDVDILYRIDGILFTGGSDVDPAIYGEKPHPTVNVRPERDAAELFLMRAAIEADLPIFGICRGMQLMTVSYGGRLHQHLPDVLGHHNHRPVTGPKFGEHAVRLKPGSRCHAILGNSVIVNSFHHQGIADPGRLTPAGWSPEDGLIEAMEDPARDFVIGVQWHPEDTTDFRLFAAHVEAARTRRDRLRHMVATGRASVTPPEPGDPTAVTDPAFVAAGQGIDGRRIDGQGVAVGGRIDGQGVAVDGRIDGESLALGRPVVPESVAAQAAAAVESVPARSRSDG